MNGWVILSFVSTARGMECIKVTDDSAAFQVPHTSAEINLSRSFKYVDGCHVCQMSGSIASWKIFKKKPTLSTQNWQISVIWNSLFLAQQRLLLLLYHKIPARWTFIFTGKTNSWSQSFCLLCALSDVICCFMRCRSALANSRARWGWSPSWRRWSCVFICHCGRSSSFFYPCRCLILLSKKCRCSSANLTTTSPHASSAEFGHCEAATADKRSER